MSYYKYQLPLNLGIFQLWKLRTRSEELELKLTWSHREPLLKSLLEDLESKHK
jgi:hypothetical protein